MSRFRSGCLYLLTAVRETQRLGNDTACLCETAVFVQSREEERKTVITAVVPVDLPFIPSEIANLSHSEIITHHMWPFLFFSIVSEKEDRPFVTPERRMSWVLTLKLLLHRSVWNSYLLIYLKCKMSMVSWPTLNFFHLFFLMGLLSWSAFL